jgi:hypothetical protein
MGLRTVYGNDHSSNGWPMVDEQSCTWVMVPGTDPPVTIEVQDGQPLEIIPAFVADINAYVEHVNDADTACWTLGNDVSDSNHLSGTAVDVDWDQHPFQIADAGWTPDKIAEIRRILNFFEGMIFWGDDWTDPKDAMHFQLASLANGGDINTYGNPAVDDFIKRKIRPDGFSTYRRSGSAPPPTPAVMTVPLVDHGDGTWGSPSPAWDHLIMRESGGDFTVVQHGYVDVNTGGNEAEGGFQITPATWRDHNGTEFAPSPRLATPQQQALVAARIFLANPSGGDWGAGLPGRENAAQLAAGLVPTDIQSQGEDDMFTDDDRNLLRQISGIFRESKSALRMPGEGTVNTCAGFAWTADGLVHPIWVFMAAKLGHRESITRLGAVAGVDLSKYPDRAGDAQLAKAMLADIEATAPQVLQNYLKGN